MRGSEEVPVSLNPDSRLLPSAGILTNTHTSVTSGQHIFRDRRSAIRKPVIFVSCCFHDNYVALSTCVEEYTATETSLDKKFDPSVAICSNAPSKKLYITLLSSGLIKLYGKKYAMFLN